MNKSHIIVPFFTATLLSFALLANKNTNNQFKPDTEQNSTINRAPKIETSQQNESENDEISVFFTGDIMLARTVSTQIFKSNNLSWSFQFVKEKMNKPDITVINLESPFGIDCPKVDTGMVFCAESSLIQALKEAGVDMANIANNHSLDQKAEGLEYTKKLLKQNGIQPLGVEEIPVSEIKGEKISFVAFNLVPPISDDILTGTEENVALFTSKASGKADITIVSFHWGNEYTYDPTENQIKLAHLAIDSGADAVIGHHPHWIQPLEIYNSKPIFYSLGNFIFDQMWSEETKKGIAVELVFRNGKIIKMDTHPVYIENFGQPKWAEGQVYENILDTLDSISTQHKKRAEVLN